MLLVLGLFFLILDEVRQFFSVSIFHMWIIC